MELKDKVIVVTGGAMGIGKACAETFIKDGAKVIIADFSETGKTTAEEAGCDFFRADIASEADIAGLRDYILEKYGQLDFLVNNAAKQTEHSFFEMSVDEFASVVNVNLTGTFACMRILGEIMKPGSSILNMLSVHYEQPRLNKFHYDASKAGVAMLTKEAALALSGRGITVNGISYGAVLTPMNRDMILHPENMEKAKEKIPLRWIATAEEIASFAKTILKEFSQYATGSVFTIDGGRRLN